MRGLVADAGRSGTSAGDAGSAEGGVAAAMRPVEPAALERLVTEARETDSDALVVLQDGKLLGEWFFSAQRTPVQTMSITKSVLSLVVGCLVEEGKLSLDAPLSETHSVWKDDPRGRITVRHLLTHSSGLDEGKSTAQIYAAKSFVEQALASPLKHPPGTHYEYGNRASNLLAGVIAQAGGDTTQAVAKRCLFEPLEIRSFHWSQDRSGQAHGMAGLHLLPRDLAKLGELVLGAGTYHGKRVLPAEWITLSAATPAPLQPASKRLGMLWWLLPEWTEARVDADLIAEWRGAGVSSELISKLEPLAGQRFRSTLEWGTALRARSGEDDLATMRREIYERGLADARMSFGPTVGAYAQGSLGQYLVVVPRDRLVAVRTRRMPASAKAKRAWVPGFPDFPARIVGLTGRSAGPSP